ncbi:MAG: hypothetical protein JOZ92_04700 [Candidatus Dormibacteraeota bacterium]|nr:hypothetical protein [Candidatus Dormibacteraeota bacterium]
MHPRTFGRILAGSAGVILALGLTIATASAHAVINVGQYRLAIGWQFEPSSGTNTYVGIPNAIQVFVDTPTASNPIGTPVSDLNSDCTKPDLQVTVTYAGVTSSPFCPSPVYDPDTGNGRLDEYDYELTPTQVGTYTFHIFGSIHGTAIDKTVASGPSTFDSVAEQSSTEFPVQVPTVGEVSTKVNQVDARATQNANSATDAANRGTILGVIAIVIALLGSGGALFVAARRRT